MIEPSNQIMIIFKMIDALTIKLQAVFRRLDELSARLDKLEVGKDD